MRHHTRPSFPLGSASCDRFPRPTHHPGPGGPQRAAPCCRGGPGGQGQPRDAAAGTGLGHRGERRPCAEEGAARHPHRGLGVAGGEPGLAPAALPTSTAGSGALVVAGGKQRPWNSWAEEEVGNVRTESALPTTQTCPPAAAFTSHLPSQLSRDEAGLQFKLSSLTI